ncbi:PucR family transcriptional regulator ligand-binding domain-containing protein [Tissierella pigra]|uniref:PucR family transcriptional regulator n=1 Tax=Tissierella pigra TaxID=2607614 RepID=A0A6N7Y178_9FIRM|nr:PucR family transcriptional regulator [Tissierella pigra]MBU5424849.1 PucR family transcriptional regulator ligand-binding domain-containing protein [Tissierella pigra]MSU02248.1 PucR family transcriptional regulator [Tissierella pigra]
MGLTVREMLGAEFFKDFKVIGGHEGLDKQIQGIAVFDAPDGYNWTKGRELIISSGYLFQQQPKLFQEYVKTDVFREISGMGIKLDRYIKSVPDNIIAIFNEYKIPLISIPKRPSWMDIMYQLNVLVMNRNIKQFRIRNINPRSFSNLSYQSRKINKILSQMEGEMNFPSMLYDLSSEKAYYSSPEFIKLMEDLNIEDFWKPSFDSTQEILCDNLNIIRYRFIDEKYDKPYSWITIPITVEDKIKAYFVVVEATGLIDYFDQFALRIGFLLLQSLYEQILVAQSIGDTGFENFINEIITGALSNDEIISKRASDIGLDINLNYYLVLMKEKGKKSHSSSSRKELKEVINSSISHMQARIAMIDDSSCIFLIPVEDSISYERNLQEMEKSAETFKKRIESKIDNTEVVFGVSDISDTVFEIKRNYTRCLQAIKMGQLLYPKEYYLKYSDLGVFAWMDIKEDELEIMLKDIKLLTENPEYRELIETLRVYLECKMNYSLTAKQLFIHINTVRKRIGEINDLINFDIEDSMNRLKLEILLKLIK